MIPERANMGHDLAAARRVFLDQLPIRPDGSVDPIRTYSLACNLEWATKDYELRGNCIRIVDMSQATAEPRRTITKAWDR